MNRSLFAPTPEGEARLLLLIDAFTTPSTGLEGRTKLAKLDFLLRYPTFLRRALAARSPGAEDELERDSGDNLEGRMVRFRYGPWDPSYFALLGSLIGRGLVLPVAAQRGIAFRTTAEGSAVAEMLRQNEAWADIAQRLRLLRRHFNLSGRSLMRFIYETFPEVGDARWGQLI